MTVVLGEIDPTGQFIHVSVTGDVFAQDQCAAVLRNLTPFFNPAKDGSVMAVPLSWAACTQLAHGFPGTPAWDGTQGLTWVPGPVLSQWLIDEVIRRSCEGDFTGRPPKLEPMPHQRAGGVAVGMNGRFLFADDMGPQPVTTPILKTDGTWTRLGSLKRGDAVYGQNGFAAKVAEVKFFGAQPVYRVSFSDRTSTLATGRHLWRVFTANHRARPDTRLGQDGYVLSTEQLLERGLHDRAGNSRFFLPQQPVAQYGRDRRWFALDPYAYGVLLGDGHLSEENCTLTCPDEDILLRVEEQVLADTMTTSRQERRPDHCAAVAFRKNGQLRPLLDSLGALVNAPQKFIAREYLQGNYAVRREVLRGLLDTDGTVVPTGAAAEFSSASAQLASDVAFLGRSLGAVVTESEPQPAHYVLDGVRHEALDKHRVHLRFPADGPNPFWCERKASRWAQCAAKIQRKQPPRALVSAEPEGEAEVCCIRLKGEGHEHVYLTDRTLIPTHNTGKGGSYLMGLAELEARGRYPWPAIVVTPAGVVDTLLEEIPLWYPDWTAVAYRGTGRAKYLKSNAQILVMGYETMRNDTGTTEKPGPLLKLKAGSVIYDECHALCNYASLQSRKARTLALHIRNVLAGSGTPITTTVAGFWPVLNSMYPSSYPDRGRYKGHYCIGRKNQYGTTSDREVSGLDPLREPEFRVAMQGVFRRVAKEDVLLDLPPKTYSTRWIDIPPAWRAAYEQMEADMLAELPDNPTPLEAMTIVAKITRLRQLACSACDVETWRETETSQRSKHFGQEVQRTKVTMREPCWKGAVLLDVLDELHEGEGEIDDLGRRRGHVTGSRPVIAFAEYSQLTRIAGKMAEAKGWRTGYIDGGVKQSARKDTRLAFQGNQLDLICVTTGAGGAGLNLTAADTEVFLARPFGYVPATQAESRAHRKGQTKPVHIIDVVAKNSVEARVRAVLREKAGNLADLVMDRRIVESFLGGGRA